ncbi:MAG: XRE family transcriptional regulator [Microscillaceae bacterium]|nr:XRE family transcriptional regulator [Microscillaceae bacterium]
MTPREENIRLIFGLKVRQLRIDRNLSLSEVSKASGISISYLNEIEKGKKYPKANKIAQMAKALGVSYDWLVSLQLSTDLRPIAELIKSDLLTSLPLEIFGIEPADLVDIISNTPSKISAFISTLIELTRNYNIGVENFYFAVLRSYQEMYDNYFEDLEEVVDQFVKEHTQFAQPPVKLSDLKQILTEQYHYEIHEEGFENYPELESIRSLLIPGNPNRLLINKHLSNTQQMFTLGRELGYCYMKIKERPYTSSWIHIQSFEQLLSNFKASYFSGALLIPKAHIHQDLKSFIARKSWNTEAFLDIMYKYQASPEMFIHRLTSLIPKLFGLNQLFFLRFNHKTGSTFYNMNKELHLGGLYNPHSNVLKEHYCRRWVSLNILKDLENLQNHGSMTQVLCQIQRSQYIDSENEFLCISMARTFSPTPFTNSSVTIGLLVTPEFKQQVGFWNDKRISVRKVGVTCERCSELNCSDRAAPAKIYQANLHTQKIQESLEKIRKEYE